MQSHLYYNYYISYVAEVHVLCMCFIAVLQWMCAAFFCVGHHLVEGEVAYTGYVSD